MKQNKHDPEDAIGQVPEESMAENEALKRLIHALHEDEIRRKVTIGPE